MCKRLAGVAVTALALTLAGCGGSSDTKQNDPEPTALETAQKALMDAQTTVDGLAEDATDAAQLAAYEALLEAAEDVVEELGDDARHSDVEAAEEVVEDTMAEIETIRGRIASAEGQMQAIGNAKSRLTTAQDAVSDTPTAAEHQAIADAAGGVVAALRANGGSQDDIAMYTGVQNLNKAWADYLNAHDGVAALTDSSTDAATRDAHQARATAAEALIPMLTDADEIRTVASAQGASDIEAAAASGRITAAQNKTRDDQRKADNAAAMQVAMAILEHSTAMDADNTPDESMVTINDDNTGLRIARGSGNAMIKLNQTDAAAKDKKFEMDTAPGAGTG